MYSILAVFLGGGVGAVTRFGLSKLGPILSDKIWLGTFLANAIGCLLFFLLAKKLPFQIKELDKFIFTGFLGALTTFSTFSYELVRLIGDGKQLEAFLVFGLNMIAGIVVGILILR